MKCLLSLLLTFLSIVSTALATEPLKGDSLATVIVERRSKFAGGADSHLIFDCSDREPYNCEVYFDTRSENLNDDVACVGGCFAIFGKGLDGKFKKYADWLNSEMNSDTKKFITANRELHYSDERRIIYIEGEKFSMKGASAYFGLMPTLVLNSVKPVPKANLACIKARMIDRIKSGHKVVLQMKPGKFQLAVWYIGIVIWKEMNLEAGKTYHYIYESTAQPWVPLRKNIKPEFRIEGQ